MDIREFIEAINNADEATLKAVYQLLEVSPLLAESLDLLSDTAHKAS